eukprot:scaffold121817_cov48-Phaeocystis_antarctica.AAC.1
MVESATLGRHQSTTEAALRHSRCEVAPPGTQRVALGQWLSFWSGKRPRGLPRARAFLCVLTLLRRPPPREPA